MNRIYIAGPMTGIPHFNFPEFDAAAEKLRQAGCRHPVSPADLDRAVGFDAMSLPDNTDWSNPDIPGFDLRDAIKRDILALMSCDAIYLLAGWHKSTGARCELALASWMGLEVVHQ